MKKRPIFHDILARLQEPRQFIQVLLGPRQVGKTTLVTQASQELGKPYHFISADLATLKDLSWLHQEWETARQKIKTAEQGCVLIIDEVQKIPHWSDVIKAEWDEDTRNQTQLSVVILGSSPWLVQQGLSESLAGRFEIIPITHWNFAEMQTSFAWDIEQYYYFGGYPGAAGIANTADPSRWINYINDSIIETTISRDILLMTQVNKPALLRRLFQLGCNYSTQIVSFTKILGQLQDAGNVTTLAHYLELLEGAGLLAGIQKFAMHDVRKRASSPKFNVFNNALLSAQLNKTFQEARSDNALWGRIVESSVGAYLLNAIRGTQIKLYYWREGDKEVDFVLQHGDKLCAIEIKTNNENLKASGMSLFVKNFKPSKVLLIGPQGISIEEFISQPVATWL